MTQAGQHGFSRQARIRSRRNAVQALYQWDMTQAPIAQVIAEFESDRAELQNADREYFRDIVSGVSGCRAELDQELGQHLDRPIAQLDPVERAVLYLGMYELKFRRELPWRVVVNEAIELAKMFGAEQSHKYINGVLDAAARRLRPETPATER